MNSFNINNLNSIKDIFEDKTGVKLAAQRSALRPLRTTAVLAAVITCLLVTTAFAVNLFSSLSGDDLSLNATYEGAGIVSVSVENKSDKELHFQSKLKLMRWNTSEEIKPISDNVAFNGTKIPAHSSGTMTIDLSKAYDIKTLEIPLTDDHYFFILTNNNFVFGQDWMCTVEFAETIVTPVNPVPIPKVDDKIVQGITKSLQFYFESISFDIGERRAMDAKYIKAYTELIANFEGNIVPSVSPLLLVDTSSPSVVFDDSVPLKEQYMLVSENWFSRDANFKLLAMDTERALVLSAELPLKKYKDAMTGLPLFYIFTYEKSAISGENDYAFIHGQLLKFSDLEKYKVYEDDQYVCYEVSHMVYSDLEEYTRSFVSRNAEVLFDEQAWKRVENIHTYYKENLGNLFYYKSSSAPK